MRTHTVRLPIYVAALVIATFAIGACGGGHGSTPGPKVLVSIAITPAGSLGFAQSHHTATRLPNGTVLAAGGGSPSTASEIYFP
jgi:hypothetical protein